MRTIITINNTVVHIYNHAIIVGPSIRHQVNLHALALSSAHGGEHERRADKSRPRFPGKRVFLCLVVFTSFVLRPTR